VAQRFQLEIRDAMQPHPELKDGHRQNLRGLRVRALRKRGTILLESRNHGTQMRIRVGY